MCLSPGELVIELTQILVNLFAVSPHCVLLENIRGTVGTENGNACYLPWVAHLYTKWECLLEGTHHEERGKGKMPACSFSL